MAKLRAPVVRWCNGSTEVFGASSHGSNPCRTAKRANPAADVSAQEREIDDRVYRLYGLTPDEIKIVEESAK